VGVVVMVCGMAGLGGGGCMAAYVVAGVVVVAGLAEKALVSSPEEKAAKAEKKAAKEAEEKAAKLAKAEQEDKSVTFMMSYDRPAQMEIPQTIRTLAIRTENASGHEDARWGQVAADKMVEQLKARSAQDRYDIVERAALQERHEESDIQVAFGDPDAAVWNVGHLTTVDAVVYVRVSPVSAEAGNASQGDAPYRVTVSMSFKLVVLSSSSTLAMHAPSYDSDSNRVDALIEQGVREFVAKISPHTVRVEEKLADGKSPAVKSGNVLAMAGEYDKALAQYREALKKNAKDHGAAFNAGLMHEAMGNIDDARAMYVQAVSLNGKEAEYAVALARVRR